jgi:ApaG protein
MSQPKNQISVSVEVVYSPKHSTATQHFYIYFITMHNQGLQSAQLLRRHFFIRNALGFEQEVEGEGVVGEHPIIAPEQVYRYFSGVPISQPPGSMRGEYIFRAADGQEFAALLPEFELPEPPGYVPLATQTQNNAKRVLN